MSEDDKQGHWNALHTMWHKATPGERGVVIAELRVEAARYRAAKDQVDLTQLPGAPNPDIEANAARLDRCVGVFILAAEILATLVPTPEEASR